MYSLNIINGKPKQHVPNLEITCAQRSIKAQNLNLNVECKLRALSLAPKFGVTVSRSASHMSPALRMVANRTSTNTLVPHAYRSDERTTLERNVFDISHAKHRQTITYVEHAMDFTLYELLLKSISTCTPKYHLLFVCILSIPYFL